MMPSGFGLTFTERDLQMAKRVKVILGSLDFKLEGALQVVQAGDALRWFEEFIPNLEKNIFEMKSETKIPVKRKAKKPSASKEAAK